MSNFPYIPKGDTTMAQALGSLGGKAGTGSLAKKYAAQLREMKKKGKTDEQIKFFVQRLEDPTCNVLHIQKLIDRFLSECSSEHANIKGIETLITLHKAHFGDKHINANLNVNIDVDVSEVEEHLKKVLNNENAI